MTREPLALLWARRAISIPIYLAMAALVMAGLPMWCVLAAAIDLGSDRRFPRVRTVLCLALYLVCELIGLIAAWGVWFASLGSSNEVYVGRNAALQRWFSGTLFHASLALFSMRLEVVGQEDACRGPFLLFVRHSSTADTVLAAALVANPNKLLLRYVLKRELLWDPCLDIVGRRLPNTFVDRSGSRSEAEIAAVARLARNLDEKAAVLIYPEGTRYSPQKLRAALTKLESSGKNQLAEIAASYQEVLPPRTGGPLALLENAPLTDVVFLAHSGFEGAASFGDLVRGELIGKTIRAKLWRVEAANIPADQDARRTWLFQQWTEVDRWVAVSRSEGQRRVG